MQKQRKNTQATRANTSRRKFAFGETPFITTKESGIHLGTNFLRDAMSLEQKLNSQEKPTNKF